MRAERVIVSFFAVIVGLAAAGIAFYFYQGTKTTHQSPQKTLSAIISPSPTPDMSRLLEIDSPKDESVSDTQTITVSGKTASDATVLISTQANDQVVKPSASGDFSASVTLPSGTSVMHIQAIFSNGDEKQVMQTITYSTETF